MGFGFYFTNAGYGERWAGYMVSATCDKRGCDEEIDRGLGYLCGDDPHDGVAQDEGGCGRYYCGKHLGAVGERGGCPHRGNLAWGKDLDCLAKHQDEGDPIPDYCLYRVGHEGPHAWEDPTLMETV